MKRTNNGKTSTRKRAKSVQSALTILDLVDDVLILIFQMLSVTDWRALRLTCRRMANLGREAAILLRYFFRVPPGLDMVLKMPTWIRYVSYPVCISIIGHPKPTRSLVKKFLAAPFYNPPNVLTDFSLPRLQHMLGVKMISYYVKVSLGELTALLSNLRIMEISHEPGRKKDSITNEHISNLTRLDSLRYDSVSITNNGLAVLTNLTRLHSDTLYMDTELAKKKKKRAA